MSKIDFTRLKELLNYDKDSGCFYWKQNQGRRIKAGDIAGCIHHNGYIVICINKKQYQAHRLAWLYIYKEFPKSSIDHINGIRSDNKISNLREATQSENCQNLKKSRGSSGFLGVSIDSQRRNRWKASIKLYGKTTHLGWYKTPQEAHQAYIEAKRKMHPFGTL
jgi:hypothetical protein